MQKSTYINLLVATIFILVKNVSTCQILDYYEKFDVYWGESFRDLGNVERILKTNEDHYISVVNRTNLLNFFTDYKKRFYFEPIEAFKPIRDKKVKLYGNGQRSFLEDFAVLNDQLIVISRRKEFFKKKVHLYYHFFDPDKTVKENHGFHLDTYTLNRSLSFDYLTVVNNLEKSKAGYLFTIPGGRNEFPTYSFGVFDSTYHLKTQGTSIFPYRNKQMQFSRSYITNTGSLYVLAQEYTSDFGTMGWGDDAMYKKQLTVFKLKDGELSDINVRHGELLLKEIELTVENDELIFSGLYADNIRSGIRGVFFIRMNDEGEVINEEFTRFSNDFLIQGQQLPQNLLLNDPNFKEGLGNYKMKDLRQTEDGGFLGIAEHFDVEDRYSGAGAPGTSNRIDTYYYYNNIMVYKLDSNGRLEWDKLITKNQHSINDGGYYLSYSKYMSDSSIFIVFNDNSKNYSENGDFLNLSNPKTAYFNSWRNAVALVEINIKNGTVSRRSIGGKKVTDTVIVPKLCIENQGDKELFLYGKSGNKHRYGRIRFNR
jgi:hypothetical protein